MTEAVAPALAGIALEPVARAAMETFVARFLARNATTNLSAARDAEALAAHVADSLTLLPLVEGPLVDVGSGGGLPAIPLAIAGGVVCTLVESVAKKARFLREIAEELGLRADVRTERAEDGARDPALRERFASATARAVGSAPTVLELTIPYLRVGGVALLQRGDLTSRERAAVADAALVLGAVLECELRPYGDADARRILVVRKTAPTGNRFPRRAGVPAKRPLCLDGGDD